MLCSEDSSVEIELGLVLLGSEVLGLLVDGRLGDRDGTIDG